MSITREDLKQMIDQIPDKDFEQIIDFLGYLIMKREREVFEHFSEASTSSKDFWDNPNDDEAWNNGEKIEVNKIENK